MTGQEYEHLVADYLRKHGYNGVRVTQASGDFGVDVIAYKGGRKYAVQCKYYTGAVGVSSVQEVVAGKAYYRCEEAMVVTNSTFTAAAEKLAAANSVVLLDGITSAGAGIKLPKLLKWVLIIGYAFFASAGVAACLDMIKGQPFWKAAHTVLSMSLVLLFPLWVRLGVKAFRHYRSQKKAPAGVAPVAPTRPTPVVVPTKPQTIADISRIRPYIGFESALEIIASSQTVSISLLQRTCKIGYQRAGRIIDSLVDAGLIVPVGVNVSTVYEWTESAKKPS